MHSTTAHRDETYEDWSNYPTWAVNLWLANEESLYHETIAKARFAAQQADPINGLAYSLKVWVEDDLTELGPEDSLLTGDLLGYALGQVDWREIAESWLDGLEDDDDQEGR